jgi:hypothetical protein
MVLRIPHTVDDRSLLEDEPFKSHFEQRWPTKEGRGRGRSSFYINLEKTMRDENGGVSPTLELTFVIFMNYLANS